MPAGPCTAARRMSASTRKTRLLRRSRAARRECARLRKIDRAALLGALIAGHEELHNLQTVFESQHGRGALKEGLNKVTILGLVTIRGRLIGDHRHLAHFGILFLDEVLAGLALNFAAE